MKNVSNENDPIIDLDDSDEEMIAMEEPIISYGSEFTIDSLIQLYNSGQIVIPDFQRRFVWDKKKSSKLIESFLLGYPVPQIFLGRDSNSETFEVIDGQQRLMSLIDFIDKKMFKEKLFKLSPDISELFAGKSFDELDEQLRRRLKASTLSAKIVVYQPKKPDIKFSVFQRINTGSVVLNQQEIRNCVYNGNFISLLNDLNKEKIWRSIVGENKDNRMRDVETILRFLAMYYNLDEYSKFSFMTSFLNDFCHKNINITKEKGSKFKSIFLSSLEKCVSTLGVTFARTKKSTRINKSLFEVIMFVAAKYPDALLDKKCYGKLLENQEFISSITSGTADKQKVQTRFSLATKYLSGGKI